MTATRIVPPNSAPKVERPPPREAPVSDLPRGTRPLAAALLFLVLFATASTLAREWFADPAQRLWVASGAAIEAVDSRSGDTLSHIAVDGALRAFTVEPDGGTVWALVGDELRSYAETGELKTALRLDIPQEGRAALALDHGTGNLWIAVDTGVALVDSAGRYIWSRPLRGPLIDLALDARRSWAWVATADQLELLDAQGRLLQQLSLVHSGPVRALAYDAYLDQAWIVGDGSLERYTWEGERTLVKVLPADHELLDLAADGRGGVWGASGRKLFHFDVAGQPASLSTRLWLGDAAGPIDLASDRSGGSVWVAGREGLRHVGYSGALLSKLVPRRVAEPTWVQAAVEDGG